MTGREQEHEILLASDPTRDAFTAEIWIGGALWAALVEYDDGRPLMLELYRRVDGQSWLLELDDAVDLLTRARTRLQLPATGSHSTEGS